MPILEEASGRIEAVMAKHGLLGAPAFSGTKFIIGEINCDHRCPLGIYDTDNNEIYLAPLFSEDTLLHELGHRYAHYYQNQPFSEELADMFMRTHRSNRLLVAEGTAAESYLFEKAEPMFASGEAALLEVYANEPFSNADADAVKQRLIEEGVPVQSVDALGRILRVRFSRPEGANLLPLFPIIGGIVILGIGGVLSWSLFRVGSEIANKLIPLALIGIGGLIFYSYIKERAGARR